MSVWKLQIGPESYMRDYRYFCMCASSHFSVFQMKYVYFINTFCKHFLWDFSANRKTGCELPK